jgi:protocatechuate 3,4-dioxygenase beta subunit
MDIFREAPMMSHFRKLRLQQKRLREPAVNTLPASVLTECQFRDRFTETDIGDKLCKHTEASLGMANQRLTRRESLMRAVALGSLRMPSCIGVAEGISALEAQERHLSRKPTQWNEIGPFYKRLAPNEPNLRQSNNPGLPLTVSGRIFNTYGQALPSAEVEIWHADHFGHYDLDGYRYRATLTADAAGQYSFASIMPGHYPTRVCQHIHYIVKARGHKPLITQLYFATDPVFEGEPEHNFSRDPLILSRELIRPVMLTGDPKSIEANVVFELVLERA